MRFLPAIGRLLEVLSMANKFEPVCRLGPRGARRSLNFDQGVLIQTKFDSMDGRRRPARCRLRGFKPFDGRPRSIRTTGTFVE